MLFRSAKAGIRPGLLLQAVDRYPTPEIAAMPPEIGRIPPGQNTVLTLVRSTRRGAAIFNARSTLRLVAR